MDQPQKIWFVYLTDHHEGPFFPDEVAAMVAAGTVNLQTLGWKDGMAEWIAIESIPELKAAVDNPPAAPSAPAAASPDADAGGSFSLAEMLARQQNGGAPAAQPEPEFSSGADALASFVGQANGVPAQEAAPSGFPADPPAGALPAAHEEVWTLRVNSQVSGLFSLNQLRNMAAAGDVPPHAMLWHSGWTDFQPLSSVPELANAAQTKRFAGGGGTNAGVAASGRKPVFAPITAAANVGDDERTDTNINAGQTRTGLTKGEPGKAGLKNLFSGLGAKFGKKPTAAPAPAAGGRTQTGIKKLGNGKGASSSPGGAMGSVKRVALLMFFFALLGGGGYGYLKYFSSPIPSALDVLPDDLELMKETASVPAGDGGRLHLAAAKGTEENPVEETTPKFYVGTNLPAGTPVHLSLVGKPGSLVNRVSFEKEFQSSVGANHIATFERLEDDGKPLPMGEYTIKVSAESATPVTADRFLGGKKGAVYQDRLKKYKDKLQAEYDKEMQELRETIDTLKALSADAAKKLAEYKAGWPVPAKRGLINADWKAFALSAQGMLTQIDQKLKARAAAGGATYQPNAFQDAASTVGQLQQLIANQQQRLTGAQPAANPEELSAAVATSVASLEQSLAQALVKSPFDILSAKPAAAPANAAPAGGEPASAESPEPAPAAAPGASAGSPAPATSPPAAE